MANMIKQYEKVRAFKCSSKEFPELGIVIAFAYNYSEARNLAKGVFKEVNPAVRYLGIRASIVLKDARRMVPEIRSGLYKRSCTYKKRSDHIVGKHRQSRRL